MNDLGEDEHEGRQGTLCYILAILRWHDKHNDQLAGESDAYTSESGESEGDDPMEIGNE